MLRIFSYICWPLYVFLGEVSVQVLCPFFNWIVCLPGVESCEFLHILEIKPLSFLSLTNMFSHTVGSLFILVMVSLSVQKLLNLTYSYLFIFPLFPFDLGDTSAKILLCGISDILIPMFSSRTFMVS